ncbi:hypothetical protein FZEAL_6488 [Fusarium zealandicum]|uniref:Complex 1 LYR protein domain-containing protein n=1 Tax=Fusarium zealandicum TaxID=1053134 RepID=A0A8H4XJF8_9HYPO|nr:hypothetical protein FZEAL_6488 [Fusarium zealandicum]
MIRQPFVPARNSRHRVASLALYRALIKLGKKVPLPKDLQHTGPRHPVAHLVRKRFAKNKPLTSLRLVYNAMAAGYKFLTLLTKGQATNNPEHSQIVQYLRKRNEASAHSRSKKPTRPTRKHNPPLLTKVSGPSEPIEYEPTVRPLPRSAFVGERKVPVLGSTAEGQVFLRIKKPQPQVLSRAIGLKTKLFREDIWAVMDIEEYDLTIADQEDRWEQLVNKQLKAEGLQDQVARDEYLGSYRWSMNLAKKWYEIQLDKRWDDWVARGKALSRLTEQERELMKKEKQNPAEAMDETEAMAKKKETLDKVLGDARKKEAERKERQSEKPFEDPFLSQQWRNHVQDMEKSHARNQNKDGRSASKSGEEQAADISARFPLDAFAAIKALRK